MIQLHTDNLQKIDPAHSCELALTQPEIEAFLAKIDARKQGFSEILDDQKTLDQIKDYAKQVQGKYHFIVVLGIGGSALGTTTLENSLRNQQGCSTGSPQLIVLDNIDPDFISEAEEVIDLASTLFIVVSKSGGTIETLSQYFYFRQKIEQANLKHNDHFLFITDPNQGLLREIANQDQVTTFSIPENVGGRFSVLTPVSLVPAALIGLDIEELISGAKEGRHSFNETDPTLNIPAQVAEIQYKLYQKGKIMNVMMPYSTKLSPITAWYAQLLAESIGKDGIGITPVQAKGVTDQHSQNQLYHDGPNDKLLIFLEIENFTTSLDIPNYYRDHKSVSYLKNSSFNELMQFEMKGTQDSLTDRNRPNIKLTIPRLNENSLGHLFFMFEASIAFLGEMFKVNAYDQPGVELSKQLTKQYYERKS